MRWNRTHPVPWRRFLREGVVFGLGMALVFFVFVGERKPGSYVGIAFGAVLYVLVCVVLAKLGHVRMTYRDMRAAAAMAQRQRNAPAAAGPARRPKPAPTSRTGGSPRKKRK